uniref:Uncharacterized protein n=1 Tax=Cacopsylla melanoneura TaxID=428564 RepID=A0A8D8LVR0_9HEMI
MVLLFSCISMSVFFFVLFPVISLKQSHIAFDLCLLLVLRILSRICFCFSFSIFLLCSFLASLYCFLIIGLSVVLVSWNSFFSVFPLSIISCVIHCFFFILSM